MRQQASVETFLDATALQAGPEARRAAEHLIELARDLDLRVAVQEPHQSKGETIAFVIPGLQRWPDATPVVVFSRGRISWQLKEMRRHNPFNNPEMEDQLRQRLASLPSTELDKPDWPDTLIEDVEGEDGFATLQEILTWTVTRIRRTNPA